MATLDTSTREYEKAFRRELRRRRLVQYRHLYLMLIPALLFFLIFKYGPMFGLVIAFRDYSPRFGMGFLESILASERVGFGNFLRFFQSRQGPRIIWNSVIISAGKLIIGFPMPIILALMLNELKSMGFKRVIQTVSYLPHFISWVVLAGVFRLILSPDFGVLLPVFDLLGMEPINFLGESQYFRSMLIATSVWQRVGWGSIIYLAAITSIDPQLYEAAYMDGATRWQQTWHITLPGIASTIVILLIISTGTILDAGFDQVFNLLNPAVLSVGQIIDTYVFQVGLRGQQFSFASAVGMFQAMVGLVLVIFTNFIAKRLGQASVW